MKNTDQNTDLSIETIQESFDETLKTADLGKFMSDSVEVAGKTLPVIKAMFALAKVGANVRDRLFCKKLISFLVTLKDIPERDRKKMIETIDRYDKYRIRVGEKLLYILDTSDDHEKAEIIGILFANFIQNKISYDDFLETSTIVNKLSIRDFNWFIEHGCRRSDTASQAQHPGRIASLHGAKYGMEFDLSEIRGLIGSGLFELEFEPVEVSVGKQDDHKILREGGSEYTASVDGGDATVYISDAGEAILKCFSKGYFPPESYSKLSRQTNRRMRF